jgi:hypothetical protein
MRKKIGRETVRKVKIFAVIQVKNIQTGEMGNNNEHMNLS